MLVDFRVANFRSLREPQEFSMLRERTDPKHGSEGWDHPEVSTVAAIFGANASGKSTVIQALRFLVTAVRNSYISWNVEGGVPRTAFLLDDESIAAPSEFEVVFIASDGVQYQYNFRANDASILSESLYSFRTRKRKLIFERTDSACKFSDDFRGQKAAIERAVSDRRNALLLSIGAQLGSETLDPVFQWITSVFVTDPASAHQRGLVTWVASRLESEPAFHNKLRAMLASADLGVRNVEVVHQPMPSYAGALDSGSDSDAKPRTRKIVQLSHAAVASERLLPPALESDGTRALITLASVAIHVLERGQVWAVDELDTSLHPLIVSELIDLFQDPLTNPHQAQIVLTTHDVSLLGKTLADESPIQRDQFWVVEKGESGASQIFAVSDYQPRVADNLERRYLSGRYGGIPRSTLKDALNSCASEPA